MILSSSFHSLSADHLYKILQLREKVFVLEQQCLYQDLDDIDHEATHCYNIEDDKVIAYARIFWKDRLNKIAQIGRVVTDPDFRRQKQATSIMSSAISIAEFDMHAEKIYLEAQTYAIPFYEQLGFSVTSEEFLEDGIPHVQMIRQNHSQSIVSPSNNIEVLVANETHKQYIPDILSAIYDASKVKGNSIVMRDPDYLAKKMSEGKAVIALCDNRFVGFCYIECWQNEQFVANSGLIVRPEFRGHGVATRIKHLIFKICRTMFPDACIFSITKSQAVIRMNTALGFERVDYDQLTNDPNFWRGCDTCSNYPILLANKGKNCHCIGLLYRPHSKADS